MLFEHSEIYVGNDQIVHLEGDGWISTVSPEEFVERLSGYTPTPSIYVACKGDERVGSKKVAKRALNQVGYNGYNLRSGLRKLDHKLRFVQQ